MEPYFAWVKFYLCGEDICPKSGLINRYRICWPIHGLYWIVGLLGSYMTTMIMLLTPTIAAQITVSNDMDIRVHLLGVLDGYYIRR